MLYGLDAVTLKRGDIATLEKCFRTLHRNIQALPIRVATEAVYLLLGVLTVEAYLYIQALTLFGSISRQQPDSPLRLMAPRQLASDVNSSSWYAYIRELSVTYSIDPVQALAMPWSKEGWNNYVREAVRGFWWLKLLKGALSKTSLKWLSLECCSTGSAHPVWSTCKQSPQQVQRASIRAKLVTGSYILQDKSAKINKFDPDPTCRLCGYEAEDVPHFLMRCEALSRSRQQGMNKILKVYKNMSIMPPGSDEAWCRAILNGHPTSVMQIPGRKGRRGIRQLFLKSCIKHTSEYDTQSALFIDFNFACNDFVYKLHVDRDIKINDIYLNL